MKACRLKLSSGSTSQSVTLLARSWVDSVMSMYDSLLFLLNVGVSPLFKVIQSSADIQSAQCSPLVLVVLAPHSGDAALASPAIMQLFPLSLTDSMMLSR
ncbi:hypothetical protein JTB14_035796 [Gonioctena quinquepunctata]|nr:hypothetical protein JTB14_035796 [Gonioctena quinquepunctata]